MVRLNASDEVITDYLHQNAPTIYEPRFEPELSPDPIITVKSRPFPLLGGANPTLIDIKLADFGQGECVNSDIHVFYALTFALVKSSSYRVYFTGPVMSTCDVAGTRSHPRPSLVHTHRPIVSWVSCKF